MRLLKPLLLIFSIFLFLFQDYVFADSELNPYRIIVKLKNMPEVASFPAIQSHLSDLENTIGLKINKVEPMAGGAYIFIFAPDQIQQLAKITNATDDTTFNNLIKALAAKNDVVYAVQDRIVRLDPIETVFAKQPATISHNDQWDEKVPDDSTQANPSWGVNLTKAWGITQGVPSVVVAVIDTGIASNNDLNANILPGYNFYDGNTDNTDYGVKTGYHGTHVAGTVAAKGTIFGMAPNVKVVPILVLKPTGYDSQIINGINWAVNIEVPNTPANPNPAKVLNLSLGSTSACSADYQAAFDAVKAKGATVIIAAGNENMDASLANPGNCANVIDVAATNCRGIRAPYSNYNKPGSSSVIALAAPGGTTPIDDDWTGILSTINNNGYIHYQGTSMAAPHVAGIAALIYSIKPNATPDQVKSWLVSTVHKFAVSPQHTDFDCTGGKTCGAGIVDAYAAVKAAQ